MNKRASLMNKRNGLSNIRNPANSQNRSVKLASGQVNAGKTSCFDLTAYRSRLFLMFLNILPGQMRNKTCSF